MVGKGMKKMLAKLRLFVCRFLRISQLRENPEAPKWQVLPDPEGEAEQRILMQPTLKMAEAYSKERIRPMLREDCSM